MGNGENRIAKEGMMRSSNDLRKKRGEKAFEVTLGIREKKPQISKFLPCKKRGQRGEGPRWYVRGHPKEAYGRVGLIRENLSHLLPSEWSLEFRRKKNGNLRAATHLLLTIV